MTASAADRGTVKERLVPGGDPWAAAHRRCLPPAWLLQDVDGLQATVGTYFREDKTFGNYVPDAWANRENPAREVGFIAFFDRSRDWNSAFGQRKQHGGQVLRALARVVGKGQGVYPLVFYVLGDASPWTMVRVDLWTGEPTWQADLHDGTDWLPAWREAGLVQTQHLLRERLKNAA